MKEGKSSRLLQGLVIKEIRVVQPVWDSIRFLSCTLISRLFQKGNSELLLRIAQLFRNVLSL